MAAVRRAPSLPPPPAAGEDSGLRARILAASTELIEKEGLAALSMREVARRAGVSHQAPYHHFADREAILAAIAEEGFADLRARMGAARGDGRSMGQRMAAMGEAYVCFALDRPAHFRVMFRPELMTLERFPAAQCQADGAFAQLVAVVEESIAGGTTRKADQEAMVSMAWSLSHGLASLLLDGPLSHKVPGAVERTAHVHAVMDLFRRIFDGRQRS